MLRFPLLSFTTYARAGLPCLRTSKSERPFLRGLSQNPATMTLDFGLITTYCASINVIRLRPSCTHRRTPQTIVIFSWLTLPWEIRGRGRNRKRRRRSRAGPSSSNLRQRRSRHIHWQVGSVDQSEFLLGQINKRIAEARIRRVEEGWRSGGQSVSRGFSASNGVLLASVQCQQPVAQKHRLTSSLIRTVIQLFRTSTRFPSQELDFACHQFQAPKRMGHLGRGDFGTFSLLFWSKQRVMEHGRSFRQISQQSAESFALQ